MLSIDSFLLINKATAYISTVIFVSVLTFVCSIHTAYSDDALGFNQFPCNAFKDCRNITLINGTHYFLIYHIWGEPFGDPQGVNLINITENTDLKALSVQIESNQNGSFRIELPWNVITAIGLDSDADFIVLEDGRVVQRGIATDPQMVILAVEFEKGTREILIGDSRMIPEFSNIVLMVTSITTAGALIVSRMSFRRLRRQD